MTYWLTTPKATSRSPFLEPLEKAVDQLPKGTAWQIDRQFPGGRRHKLRSGVGPPSLRMAS